MTKITAIIQARMGSTRLPGKVMKTLCGKTILAHDIARVSQSRRLDQIVIATTTEASDAAIVEEAKNGGAGWFRGSEEDVLSRYYHAALKYPSDIIVRITSDCPLYDWGLLDEMLDAFDPSVCDYLSNTLNRFYPRGLDTEIFTFQALEKAFREAKKPHEHEHVTPYLHQNPALFRLQNYGKGPNLSHLRWTLDTQEDWDLIRRIYESLYPTNPLFTTQDILDLLKKNPKWKDINAHVEQKKLEG